MNIHEILETYDSMFTHYSLEEIEDYLYQKIIEAMKEYDDSSLITLLNEMIGLCRDTSQKDKALTYASKLKQLLNQFNLQNTQAYATSLQNIANAYRAFALYNEALDTFKQIEEAYKYYLDNNDALYASLYNNYALLYQELNNHKLAIIYLKKALSIIQLYNEPIKEAITKTNIASSYIALKDEEGLNYILDALKIYETEDINDFHYNAALNAMGDYYYFHQEYKQALSYYQRSLVHILRHTYKTDNYYRVLEKYHDAKMKITQDFVSNLVLCKTFYEEKIKPMIHEQFREYEERICVGLIGEGSDCFGFDDEISLDHDYDLGVCLLITRDDYEIYGKRLQESYDHIIDHSQHLFLKKRRGVFIIEDYFINNDDISISTYVNGEIYRDDLGIVTQIRKNYYKLLNEDRNKRIGKVLHDFSQYGQVNYGRMMARNDYISATLCLSKTIESAFDLVYLLNNQYAPYYKWKRKGIEQSQFLNEIVWVADELITLPLQKEAWNNEQYDASTINTNDLCIVYIELMAKIFVEELNKQGIIKGKELFLESYVRKLIQGE